MPQPQLTQNQIRQSYLDFFRSKEHRIVPSAPVVPQGDPTLLFTNAGMNQFKDIFLGFSEPEKKRVADSQKCIRVSGKHNDLEEVGVDTYHHTFFEMLGNWSFGDYYKEEAISWAWELLTKVWGLPKEKLYATVHHTDAEAAAIWKKVTDINPAQVLTFGDKDNFWEMGDTGPCGPCSEIHIDLGPEVDADPKAGVNTGSPRFREIWNLVFIQYNRVPGGKLEELKSKHVDTGMGFERIVAIIQGKESNYDSDVFQPIIQAVETLSGIPYQKEKAEEKNRIAMRVIADHLRTISFSIADGVVPSNEGRGYVIRRVLRRALRYGRSLGMKEPFLYKLVAVLAKEMGGTYGELVKNQNTIEKVIRSEEETFIRTLDKGLSLFDGLKDKAVKSGSKTISGLDTFTLYDTFGFPFDLTALLARENGLSVDEPGFEKEMEKQRARSRSGDKESTFEIDEILKQIPVKTIYVGDVETSAQGKLLAIIKDGATVKELSVGEKATLVFDRTVFYGEGGGQVGDRGTIGSGTASFEVETTQKKENYFLHIGILTKGKLSVGDTLTLGYDDNDRRQTRKNHSATHLLQKALRTVLGDHIKQAGSLVTPDKLRFDFNHFSPLTSKEIETVEDLVNEAILHNLKVDISEMKKTEADKLGAMAFFGDKYGDTVRVVNMENHSVELCGGSHVGRTGEIGPFRILSESSSASGIRRIEATTGAHVLRLTREEARTIQNLSAKLQVPGSLVLERIEQLLAEKKELEKKLGTFAEAGLTDTINALPRTPIGKAKFIYGEFQNTEVEHLRSHIDQLKNQEDDTVIFFSDVSEGKIVFLCGVSKGLTAKVKAGDLVKKAAELTGGGGGGRPDFAQAGGKDLASLPKVKSVVEEILRKALV